MVANLELDPQVPTALDRARAAGWTPVVVTNGTVRQQERKLRHTGLGGHVAGWVISEGAGVRKPDPRVFRLAAEEAGLPLAGAWVVGDSAEADIGAAGTPGCPASGCTATGPGRPEGFRPHADRAPAPGHRGGHRAVWPR